MPIAPPINFKKCALPPLRSALTILIGFDQMAGREQQSAEAASEQLLPLLVSTASCLYLLAIAFSLYLCHRSQDYTVMVVGGPNERNGDYSSAPSDPQSANIL